MTTKRSNVDKFTGKERDWESGVDSFGTRYLGSSPSRFMPPMLPSLFPNVPFHYNVSSHVIWAKAPCLAGIKDR